MSDHRYRPEVEMLSVTDTGRRRRWTDAQKVRIVEESHREGMTLAEVSRRHEISRSMLYDWRYRHKTGLLGSGEHFMRLFPLEGCASSEVLQPPPPSQPAVMTVDFGERCRVTIPADFDMDAAARLLNGLAVAR